MDIDFIKGNNLLLLEVVSGSQAYGLATATSDTDIKGVYYLPRELLFANENITQVSNESNDIVYYELGKFIELLCKNNPNILEILASPESCILYKHPVMDRVKPEIFLSKLAKDSFAGYAFTQIKKARGLNKKFNNPIEERRKTVLNFCYILQENDGIPLEEWLKETGRNAEYCGLAKINHTKGIYALYYDENANYKGIAGDENSNEVNCSAIKKSAQVISYLFFNKESYSSHCKNYREYWDWVAKRNEHRYKGNQEHGRGYDAKNMMHTIRLLQVAKELLLTSQLNVHRKNREELLSIKGGKLSYEALLAEASTLMKDIEAAALISSLPETPDEQAAKELLVSIREELYR